MKYKAETFYRLRKGLKGKLFDQTSNDNSALGEMAGSLTHNEEKNHEPNR
ncbi:MAG: hypothetical protein AAF988_07425 [Pseudomonadota bacterium]